MVSMSACPPPLAAGEERPQPESRSVWTGAISAEPDTAAIGGPLLRWFRAEQRDLPWRRDADPYAIWVSEIMLQQTQVATVIPYFELWMARFPSIRALARASEDQVLHAWQGLGYYSRARNLLKGARLVEERFGGRMPRRVEELLSLPGVGQYTAGAIASIAYNEPAPIVDGNVIRVLTRLFALRGDPARAPLKGGLWELAAALIPAGQARDFNPALMELGATVCTPVRPRCEACPLAETCQARKAGVQESLPETAPRPQVTPVHMVAGVVWRGGRVLLAQRRKDESRWAGMWQFPNVEIQPGETVRDAVRRAVSQAVGVEVSPRCRAAVVRHSVTRYRMTLEAYHCMEAGGEPRRASCQAWNWACPAQLGDYALPAAHRNIARRLLREEGQLELRFSG
jgi:A/G-specific adenine glycosylase